MGRRLALDRCRALHGAEGEHQGTARSATSSTPPGANRALELLGKELGMFVDRSEVDTNIRVISAQPVSEADWEAKYAGGRKPAIEHDTVRTSGCGRREEAQ